jgi:hypothetical protein
MPQYLDMRETYVTVVERRRSQLTEEHRAAISRHAKYPQRTFCLGIPASAAWCST